MKPIIYENDEDAYDEEDIRVLIEERDRYREALKDIILTYNAGTTGDILEAIASAQAALDKIKEQE